VWFVCLTVYAVKVVNPLQYGLRSANSPVEKYWVLYKTHVEAARINAKVSYKGIKSLHVEIPSDGEPIPLSDNTDFCNLRLYVKNIAKDIFLFKMSNKLESLPVKKSQIDVGNFEELKTADNVFLLLVTDKNLWVKKRVGKDYGHNRRDLLVVRSGKAINHPISPYNNNATKVKVDYCCTKNNPKTIKNLEMFRDEDNTNIVNLLLLENQYNVHISNIFITTPDGTLVNDHQFFVRNCSKVNFDNIKINGTYSRENHSGYGIYLQTVYDVCFNNLIAHGKWGVFGTVNVSNIKLTHCDINRFDIHCYGRDVSFSKCVFRNLRNSFTSVFGRVTFDNCEFVNFVPFGFRGDYNAFTPFKLIFRNCIFHANRERHSLISARSLLESPHNDRTELSKVYWPDVEVDNLRIIRENGYRGDIFLFALGHSSKKRSLRNIPSKVILKNIKDDKKIVTHN
jgi:hypothetical protein